MSEEGRATTVLEGWLAACGQPWERGAGDGEFVVTLPGEAKLRTTVRIVVGRYSMAVLAFVVRHADENHTAVYRWLLARNLRLPGIAFAVDEHGDVYLTGRLPVHAVTDDAVDHLLGALLSTADEAFNELLAMGFLSSMKREWQWRISRGEPTNNLEAFRHLLAPDE